MKTFFNDFALNVSGIKFDSGKVKTVFFKEKQLDQNQSNKYEV